MSKRLDATITCPKCSHNFLTKLYRTLWVEDPDNMALVLNDQVNTITCPRCNLYHRLEFPFLCTNVKRGFALWYEPYHDRQIDKDAADFHKHMGADSFYAKAPRVSDWEEFKRKLLELDASSPNQLPTAKEFPEMQKSLAGFVRYIEQQKKKQQGNAITRMIRKFLGGAR